MLRRTLVTLILVMTIFSTASAEKFTFETDGYHSFTKEEAIESAEDAAVNDALKRAVEQIGVRINAYSEVINKVLKEDVVQQFASAVVQIREKTLTPKIMNGDYCIYAHVICVIDTDDIDKWEPPDMERQRRLEEDNRHLENEKARIRAEKSIVESEYKRVKDKMDKVREEEKERNRKHRMEQEAGDIEAYSYFTAGDKAYLNDDISEAVKNWIKVRDMSRQVSSTRSLCELACYRLAMVYWNMGDYALFDNEIFNEHKDRFGRNGWWNYLYADWLNPDTKMPKHGMMIDIKKVIKDKLDWPMWKYDGHKKYFKKRRYHD